MFTAKRFVVEASGMVDEGIDTDTAVSHVCFRHRLGQLERQDILDAVLHARQHAEHKVVDRQPHTKSWRTPDHATPEEAAAARCQYKD